MDRFTVRAAIGTGVLTGALLLGTAVVMAPARAQLISPDEQLSVSLNLLPGETYEAFLQRAEGEAAGQIDNYFERTGADSVLLTLNGSHEGLVAPVMEVAVSREQWAGFSQVDYWATYFTDSDVLLGLSEPDSPASPTVADEEEPEEGDDVAGEADQPSSEGTVISIPAGDAGSISQDAADEAEPVEAQTSTTVPASEVAPFEPTPDGDREDDVEDSDDLDDLSDPNGTADDLTDENGAIQPQTSTTVPASEVAPFEPTPDNPAGEVQRLQ